MFTLFALLKDPAGAVTNDVLLRDLMDKFHLAHEYKISTQDLVFPRVTEVVMRKGSWEASFQIRPGDDMTLSLVKLQKLLGKKAKLPADFQSYDTEIAIGFNDDPEKKFTNDIIEIAEFVRDNYPGVVIFNQYERDVW